MKNKSLFIILLALFLACLVMMLGSFYETDVLSTAIQIAVCFIVLAIFVTLTVKFSIINPYQRQLRRLNQKLKNAENRLTVASDRMNEGLVITNSELIILSLNRMAMELLQTGTNCVGCDIRKVAHYLISDELFKRAESGEHVEELIENNGFEYQIKISAILSDSGIKGYVMLIFDATQRERSEQMRREFTANVSHELKTPLHSILGCAELLNSGMVKPEDAEQFSGQIYSEAKRMVSLIEDIINLSRLDEGSLDMQRTDVDLYELALSTAKTLEGEAAEAGISFDIEGESAVISGIAPLLGGIMLNLCDNAIKYNKENGTVKIIVHSEEGSVMLSVSDTGIGIPAEHQSRVFERFYRVDKSHSKEVGGTGLGLSIVKHSARLHGAKIEMQSVDGEGTTITLRFPKSM